ncbi:hypothetical protein TRIUR3_22423 [Triticum urartu]|uniref:Late embryogenesis abundant protein LEA-2 subgroup domain-containing protein n=1 Tax=Triticum urartu TaxID=4572 RepID=M8A3I2_TRIUA|nr:hypothetical protein TRIUR3_22423 [Triticum urartu]
MSHDSTAPGCAQACCNCCCNWVVTSIIIVIVVLIAAYAVVLPLRITAEDASLGRLALAGPNGTALAYNLSLTVGLFNPNWAMRAELTAPLESELSFAGVRFDGARLSDAGRRIEIHETTRFRVEAGAEGADAALGSAELAELRAELVKETAAGLFESLELKITGRLRYRPVHAGGTRRLEARCPLKLRLAPPPGTHMLVLDRVLKCHRL